MRMAMTALAVVFLAGATPTLAQPREGHHRPNVPGDSVGRPGPWTPGVEPRHRDHRDLYRRDGERPGESGRDDHRDHRRDGDHRDNEHRRWDPPRPDHRPGDYRPRDHRRWDHHHHRPVYQSPHRYRHYWRPPPGFYIRSWGYGEFLPRGWYDRDYRILEPWRFDLPLAPPGFDWVRSGDDALLIDRYSGRIVQVVRYLFW